MWTGLEYREDSTEELPELIHEAEDGEEPPSCADSAEEELPELIASDEEETRAMWIGEGDDDELPEIICHEGYARCPMLARAGDLRQQPCAIPACRTDRVQSAHDRHAATHHAALAWRYHVTVCCALWQEWRDRGRQKAG